MPTRPACFITVLAAILSCLALSACGDETEPDASPGYVGSLDGTDAYVSALIGETGAVLYVCNGEEELALWFEGPIAEPGQIELATEEGDTVSATLVDGGVTGTVTLASGIEHGFRAETVGGNAGLYRALSDEATEAGIHAGWVVGDDGSERGAFRRGRTFAAAPPLDRTELRIDGMVIPIFRMELTPAAPSPIPIPYPNTGGSSGPTGSR